MKARRVVVESFFIPVATALGSVPRTCELNEIWVASKPSPHPLPNGEGISFMNVLPHLPNHPPSTTITWPFT